VVGGTGGIGKAVALELASRGAALIIHGGSSRAALDSTLGELAGAEASGFLLEIDRPSRLAGLLPSLGRIDILAVAFGPFLRKSLADTTPEDWEELALLDLALPGALASALLPGMAARGWGRILLFGGTGTDRVRPYSTNAAYASAKTGLASLTKSIAAEGAPGGVGCVLVCPGFVDTEYMSEADRARARELAPGGRLLSPRDVAGPAVDLISAEPCAASGAVLSLDGGLSR
jgi:NAD(P)-dependent dehydrogenase (short-subunit alcohol dehydrogenase family)